MNTDLSNYLMMLNIGMAMVPFVIVGLIVFPVVDSSFVIMLTSFSLFALSQQVYTPFMWITICFSFVLMLSAMHLFFELPVKAQGHGPLRRAASSEKQSLWIRLVVCCKLLQGFDPSHLFEYCMIGRHWAGSIPVFVAWSVSLLRHSHLSAVSSLLTATSLSMLMHFFPFHLCTFAYTGRNGAVHGFGLNLYAFGTFSGRRFEGERLLALDWHNEKLPEQGADRRWLPRGQTRTVCRPHVHLCAWHLEFWPWVRYPTDHCVTAMNEAKRAREERRQAKSQVEIEVAVATALEELDVKAKLCSGCSIASVANEVALHAARLCSASGGGERNKEVMEHVRRVAGRAVGHVYPQCRSHLKAKTVCNSVSVPRNRTVS